VAKSCLAEQRVFIAVNKLHLDCRNLTQYDQLDQLDSCLAAGFCFWQHAGKAGADEATLGCSPLLTQARYSSAAVLSMHPARCACGDTEALQQHVQHTRTLRVNVSNGTPAQSPISFSGVSA
jgi:hypothetical protein